MYLNYQNLTKACVEARACINALEATVVPEVAYKRWKELEKIAHKQAQHIKYSASSIG